MSEPLRVGILGAAHINQVAIFDAAQRVTDFMPAAIASRSLAKAEAYAAQHGIPRAYGDYRAVIEATDIDAIYIPLPNSQHAEWSIAALDAGKAVLCEKPLAMNAVEAQQICDAVDRTKGIFVEAFHYRYHTFIRRIKQLLDDGAVGQVKRLSMTGQVPGARMASDNIRLNPALGGGVTMDLGVYAIDGLRYLTGETPRVVSAEPEISRPEIDGAIQVELEFPSGVAASFFVSHIAKVPQTESELEIIGTDGTLHASRAYLPHNNGVLRLKSARHEFEEKADTDTTYMFQARAFLEHARRRRPVETDARSGLVNMQVIDDVYRAAGLRPRGT